MAASALRVRIVSPERVLYEGEADGVVVPAWEGELGVLRGHAPLVALLRRGEVKVRRGDRVEHFAIDGGVLQVVDDVVTVVSEHPQTGAAERIGPAQALRRSNTEGAGPW